MRLRNSFVLWVGINAVCSISVQAAPVGTAFTYEGFLAKQGNPVTSVCSFEFSLWDASSNGNQISSTQLVNTGVTDGDFRAVLDFGAGAFTGDARWLQIVLQCSGDPGPLTLSPRVELTPVPYAIFASNAEGAGGDVYSLDAADGNPVDVVYVDNDGLVGVGTTTPTQKLDVAGNLQASGTIQSGSSITVDGTAHTIVSDAGLELYVGDGRALRIETNATSPNLVGGHSGNSLTAGVTGATIAGGGLSGAGNNNRITDSGGFIGGGIGNVAGNGSGTTEDRRYATVAGGSINTASGSHSSVLGGKQNTASGVFSTVGGGGGNSVVDGNVASGVNATVVGGRGNLASGLQSFVGGGGGSSGGNIASGANATICGGESNIASGVSSTVPGGTGNLAGGTYSFAGGFLARVRTAAQVGDSDGDEGVFMWSDSSFIDFVSDGPNQFLVRASGGTKIYSNSGLTAGVTLPSGGGAWSAVSDKNLKENFAEVDTVDLLERLAAIPITSWNYKSQKDSIRHIGPMGQDFHAAFGVGETETRITTIDADGVALAAIQGLHQVVKGKECEIENLQLQISELREMVETLAAQRNGGGK